MFKKLNKFSSRNCVIISVARALLNAYLHTLTKCMLTLKFYLKKEKNAYECTLRSYNKVSQFPGYINEV